MAVSGRQVVFLSGGILLAGVAQAAEAHALPLPLPVSSPLPVKHLLHVPVPAVATIASPASGNTCVISSNGSYSTDRTVHGSGLLGGSALQLPTDGGRNECGNVGMVCCGCGGCGGS
ncbi:hypothetical protein AB0O07_00630 [Streptomyces sp. NPDC093085]|uniref:hypothetical protein n=1 Tax=Streptomyces sp. NPDC093085 TaxID=3155068 RepID=UPI00344230B6